MKACEGNGLLCDVHDATDVPVFQPPLGEDEEGGVISPFL